MPESRAFKVTVNGELLKRLTVRQLETGETFAQLALNALAKLHEVPRPIAKRGRKAKPRQPSV